MKSVSVIVAFKNRDKIRVENFLESFLIQDYPNKELIFINQGSNDEISNYIEALLKNKHQVRYINNYTQGHLWNKSNALNIGIKNSSSHYILIIDVDVILTKTYISNLISKKNPNEFITPTTFYLDKSYSLYFDDLVEGKVPANSTENFIGICFVKRDVLVLLGGYDEFYSVWGAEDDDIIIRLNKYGLARNIIPACELQSFHQWHESLSPRKPTIWYLQMVQYLSFKKYVHNEIKDNWGNLISQSDRLIDDEFYNLKWDLELRVSNETGYLLFNPLIDAINNPSLRKIYFEFTYEPKKTIRRKWFKFYKTQNTNNILDDISIKDVLDFVQYFIGVFRHILADYSLMHNNEIIKLGFVKSNETP